GKFIQADTIVPNAGNPQSFNRYAYTLNNPIKYTDPTGHDVMLVGGFGSHDWEDPETWREWVMAYKGWTNDDWHKYFYGEWMEATRAGDDAAKQTIMKREGVHIFNWNACGCGTTGKQSSRNASIDWGIGALEEQMEGMQDITMIGHSKGGNLVLHYISTVGHKHNVKNAITAGSPLWSSPFNLIPGASKLFPPFVNNSAANSNVVVLNHVADPITNGPFDEGVLGANNRMYYFYTTDPHAFHRNLTVAEYVLSVAAPVAGDRNARKH
ncbi:MAG: hypothetical protein H0T73_07940, partial [Ardenticatenales bacterium]|nr:hypothetical protein [Ardenticatenales bacterium]